MANEIDLWIVEGDLAFGADGEPLLLGGLDAVSQDVAHRILESGLAPELVAADATAGQALQRLAQVVEEDLRIRPGSAVAASPQGLGGAPASEPDAAGRVLLTARLMDGTTLQLEA